jgi:hypothetical protein
VRARLGVDHRVDDHQHDGRVGHHDFDDRHDDHHVVGNADLVEHCRESAQHAIKVGRSARMAWGGFGRPSSLMGGVV